MNTINIRYSCRDPYFATLAFKIGVSRPPLPNRNIEMYFIKSNQNKEEEKTIIKELYVLMLSRMQNDAKTAYIAAKMSAGSCIFTVEGRIYLFSRLTPSSRFKKRNFLVGKII